MLRRALFSLMTGLAVAASPGHGANAPSTDVPVFTVEAASAALSVAQENAAKAERDLNRQRNLRKSDASTQASVDQAQAVFARARAARDAADVDLRRALQAANASQLKQ